MTYYSTLLITLVLCLQPVVSVSMSSGVEKTVSDINALSWKIVCTSCVFLIGFDIAKRVYKDHHRSILNHSVSRPVDEEIAKNILRKSSAQKSIKELRDRQQQEKQQFFERHYAMPFLKRPFDEHLRASDGNTLSFCYDIIRSYASESESRLKALERIHIADRCNFRQNLLYEEKYKKRNNYKKYDTVAWGLAYAAAGGFIVYKGSNIILASNAVVKLIRS